MHASDLIPQMSFSFKEIFSYFYLETIKSVENHALFINYDGEEGKNVCVEEIECAGV